MTFVMIAVPVFGLLASLLYSVWSVKRGKRPGRAFATQLLSFLFVAVISMAVPMIASAAAQGAQPNPPVAATADMPQGGAVVTSETPEASAEASQKGLGLIAAALAVGIAGIGGGIAVAAAAPAAIGATSEDPKAFGKAMIFVALGEGIALYGLLIAILIWVKV